MRPEEDRRDPLTRRGGRGERRATRLRLWMRAAATAVMIAACLLLMTGCVYRWVASRRLVREIADTPRDPKTGIMLGAEPIAIGSGSNGVLLLHGFVGSPADFGQLPPRLAEAGFRVRCPLLPGHGTVPPDLADAGPDHFTQAAEAAYVELRGECDAVAVVGFSVGGALAVRLATEGRVPPPEALVLVCPHFGVKYRWYAVLPPETWNRVMAPLLPYVIKGRTYTQIRRREVIPQLVSYKVVPTCSMRRLNLWIAEFRKAPPRALPRRTLLIYSTGDGAASWRRTIRLADLWRIPEASRIVLENTNHIAFWDYDRERAIKAVVEFLRDTGFATQLR